MLFWVGLVVIFVVFVSVVTWAIRGYGDRYHEPGTTHLAPPRRGEGRDLER